MFKIGDRVKTNDTWNILFENTPISGIITNIRIQKSSKIKWDTINGLEYFPRVVFGEYEEITLLTIDGNKEHEMNETLFEMDE